MPLVSVAVGTVAASRSLGKQCRNLSAVPAVFWLLLAPSLAASVAASAALFEPANPCH